jgi:DNA-binding response OmpR family regulator
MNGYNVLEHLKANMELRHLPVIMILALDEIASAIKCIELHAEDDLAKPLNGTLLRARVGASSVCGTARSMRRGSPADRPRSSLRNWSIEERVSG